MNHQDIKDQYPTNLDLKESFEKHAQHDVEFQNETRETDKNIQVSLFFKRHIVYRHRTIV